MKKFIAIMIVLLAITLVYADTIKITEMTEDTTPTSDDLVATVNDPGGIPANKKVTLGNLGKGITTINGLTPVLNKIMIGDSAPSWSVSSYTIATPTTGGLFYGSGTGAWANLNAGTSGKLLQMGASIPGWSTPTFPTASPGALTVLRGDGTNWITSGYTLALPTTSGQLLQADGTNWIASSTLSAPILLPDGSAAAPALKSTSGNPFYMGGHIVTGATTFEATTGVGKSDGSGGANVNIYATLGTELITAPMVTDGWTLGYDTGGWAITAGVLAKTASTGTLTATAVTGMTSAPTAGVTYKVTIVSSAASGSTTYTLGGVTGTTISTATTTTDYITARTTAKIIFSGVAATTVSLTSVSVKALTDATGDLTVNGNLTVQSPSIFNSSITQNRGQLLLPDGSAAAPSLTFGSDQDTGIYRHGSNEIGLTAGGSYLRFDGTNFQINSGSASITMGGDVGLARTAANTLALKYGNAEQQFDIYSGNGAYGLIRSKQELVTTTAAPTATTAAGFIPDGAVVLAVSTYVQTAITVESLTGYNIGDGVDPDRWGAITGHAVGTKSNNSDWTATTIQAFIAAQAITLTSVGADFPAGGKIRVCITYISNSEPTS